MDVMWIEQAVANLEVARNQLRKGGAKNAAAYVQRAIKSARGAYNHAYGVFHYRQGGQRNV
jgi:HEPN domain-containing protein